MARPGRLSRLGLWLLPLLLCWLLTPSPALATRLTSPRVSLAGAIDVLQDEHGQWTVQDLTRPDVARRFTRLSGQPSLGYLDGLTWLRITLERPAAAPERWWLEVAAPLLDDIGLYMPTGDGRYTERHSGTDWPIDTRDIAYRVPVFTLQLPPDTPTTVYIRLDTNNTRALRLAAWTPEAYAVQMSREQLMFALFVATHLIVALFSLWNYRASREVSYAYLAAFALANVIATSASEGFIFQFLMPGRPDWSESIMLLFWVAGSPLYVNFLLDQLKVPRHQGWGRRYIWLHWTLSALTFTLARGETFSWIMPKFQIWLLLSTGLHLVLLVRRSLRGEREAKLLLAGSLLLWAGVFVRFGRNLAWLPSSMASEYLYLFGLIGHLLVMSYAASRRYEDLRHANETAQRRALDLAQDAERRLEAQVAARTDALHQALELARTSLEVEREAHEDQRRFFATVSHELRTPLAVIDASVQNLALDSDQQDEATRRRHKKIQRASEQLAALVKNCFHEDRFELLNRQVLCQPTDLRALLTQVRDWVLLQSSRHPVVIDAPDLPETFACDPELTGLSLRTLAGNAVRYTPPDTRIVLRGRREAQGVWLEVIDNGPGVAPEDLPNLSRRYYRGRNAATVPGTGLGLALARELVRMQGGTLTLDSAPGQGFRASIWLPLLTDADPVPAAATIGA